VSPLLALHDDLLQALCARLPASQLVKHIVFHTQEQWLVAARRARRARRARDAGRDNVL
jgi:hypothetical protein